MTGTRETPLGLPVVVAPLVDALCLIVFVAAGRQSHDLQGGASWFFIVLWPLLAGWFLTALAARLYVRRDNTWLRLAATLVIGIAIAMVLRATASHRDTPVAFVVVAYLFITALTVGWRLGWIAVLAMRRRRGSSPGAPASP